MLQLIRPINIVIAALCMVLQHYFLIKPLFTYYRVPQFFSDVQFALLCLSTLCILAAGYIINDIFDVDIDAINKPTKQIVGNKISLNQAKIGYATLNITGLILAVYLCFSVYSVRLILWFTIPIGLLYFYSSSYKKMFLVGNIVVAVCTAMLVSSTSVFNYIAVDKNFIQNEHNYSLFAQAYYPVFIIVSALTLFSFLATIVREIIKDCEDYDGDEAYNCNTLPIKYGTRTACIVALGINVLIVILLLFSFKTCVEYRYWFCAFWHFIVVLFIGYQSYFLLKTSINKDYNLLSQLSKYVFLTSILFPVIYFIEVIF